MDGVEVRLKLARNLFVQLPQFFNTALVLRSKIDERLNLLAISGNLIIMSYDRSCQSLHNSS